MVSPNIKPGILCTHPYYEQFDKADAFIKTADGQETYVDRWWGRAGVISGLHQPQGSRHLEGHDRQQSVLLRHFVHLE